MRATLSSPRPNANPMEGHPPAHQPRSPLRRPRNQVRSYGSGPMGVRGLGVHVGHQLQSDRSAAAVADYESHDQWLPNAGGLGIAKLHTPSAYSSRSDDPLLWGGIDAHRNVGAVGLHQCSRRRLDRERRYHPIAAWLVDLLNSQASGCLLEPGVQPRPLSPGGEKVTAHEPARCCRGHQAGASANPCRRSLLHFVPRLCPTSPEVSRQKTLSS